MSSDADGFVSGNGPFVPGARETSLPDFGLVGSRGMKARKWLQAYVALVGERVNARPIKELTEPSVRHRFAQGDRPRRIGQDIRRFRRHRRKLAVVGIVQEFVEHGLDRA